MIEMKHKICVHFTPDIEPTNLQLLCLFFFRYVIHRVLLHNINSRIEVEKASYSQFLVFIGLWIMMATIQGTSPRDFWLAKKTDLLEGAPFHVSDYIIRNWL